MTLRDEIATALFERHYHENPQTRYYDMQDAEDEASDILALIEGQRCEWHIGFYGWKTGCGKSNPYYKTQLDVFCRFCGKRIEVKDETS